MRIVWDEQRTAVEADEMKLVIRSGVSQALLNVITSMKFQGCGDYSGIVQHLVDRVSEMPSSADALPNVPEMMWAEIQTPKRTIEVVIAWGIVLLDWRQRRGEYRFVVLLGDELEEALLRVFDLERILVVA